MATGREHFTGKKSANRLALDILKALQGTLTLLRNPGLSEYQESLLGKIR